MFNQGKKLENNAEPILTADKLKEAASLLGQVAKDAKAKFQSADPKTKKKIVAGIAGAALAIAAVIGAKKAGKRSTEK